MKASKTSKLKKYLQDLRHGRKQVFGIQSTIMAALTIITILIATMLVLLLYNRYAVSLEQTTTNATSTMMDRTSSNLENYLISMRKIADAVNYNIIQEKDITDPEFSQEISLLYESNNNRLVSIAIYDNDGKLLIADPFMTQKRGLDVKTQGWFVSATSQIENMHFSAPHLQNLFTDSSHQFHWVVSLSRSVDLANGDSPRTGVLLVDMNYDSILNTLENINETENGQYYYLCDSNGNIIYHPDQIEISRGMVKENNHKVKGWEDGVHVDHLNGQKRNVIVRTVSYTGWKLVGVIPNNALRYSMRKFRFFVSAAICLLLMMLLVVNRIVARKISTPILKLNDSVKAYEAGDLPSVYIGGSAEIRHLGLSVQKSYEQIDKLMNEIVEQQNRRRKSEMDALQSQINPHFLYNTLDSITWMIEAGRDNDAVLMISELAKLFRISLSKGHTIISIADELQHSRSYMEIQKVRYKNRFKVTFDVAAETEGFCTCKLILQPILENAIYYGVGNMDEDDGGEIIIRTRKEDSGIAIDVIDNGMGMTEAELETLLTTGPKKHSHGSGVGVVNVHQRIQLLFGEAYGITAESEPDEGTTITVHLPAIEFNDETQASLEKDAKWKEATSDEN